MRKEETKSHEQILEIHEHRGVKSAKPEAAQIGQVYIGKIDTGHAGNLVHHIRCHHIHQVIDGKAAVLESLKGFMHAVIADSHIARKMIHGTCRPVRPVADLAVLFVMVLMTAAVIAVTAVITIVTITIVTIIAVEI